MTELKLRIGSRKSELALKQTYIIEDLLKKAYPGLETEIVTSDTLGDKNLISPLQAFGGKGVFVSELEDALLSGEIAHPGKKKVLRTFLFHHLELTQKEFRVSEIINHMPAFHVVAGIAICTPHCAANDDIHVLNLIFDTNTHDFCHSSRFFLMRSRHSSNRVISSSEKSL